jgi:hypothetical protein
VRGGGGEEEEEEEEEEEVVSTKSKNLSWFSCTKLPRHLKVHVISQDVPFKGPLNNKRAVLLI